jgi:peroxiredoxin
MKATSSRASTAAASQGLEPGDIPPNCILPDTDGNHVDLRADSIAGNPIVLAFCPQLSSRAKETLSYLSRNFEAISAEGARIFAVSAEWDSSLTLNFPILLDVTGQTFRSFAVNSHHPSILVLRRNYHVAAFLTGKPEAQVSATLSILRRMAWERQTAMMRMHPPILQVPEVLSKDDCARLIDIFEKRGQIFVDPQPIQDFMNGTDFKMRIPENGRGDRIDHFLFESETLAFLNGRLNRVWPQVLKAFHYRISKCETLRIAKYQGQRGGKTYGHRDNNPPTLYRRFALSMNLNTEGFMVASCVSRNSAISATGRRPVLQSHSPRLCCMRRYTSPRGVDTFCLLFYSDRFGRDFASRRKTHGSGTKGADSDRVRSKSGARQGERNGARS